MKLTQEQYDNWLIHGYQSIVEYVIKQEIVFDVKDKEKITNVINHLKVFDVETDNNKNTKETKLKNLLINSLVLLTKLLFERYVEDTKKMTGVNRNKLKDCRTLLINFILNNTN